MLNTQTLEWLMACERLKEEMSRIESEGATILGRFDRLERDPTAEERDARREDYLDNRAQLQCLGAEYCALNAAIETQLNRRIN